MSGLIASYFSLVGAIVILDLLWLGVVMKDFYRAELGHLLGANPVWAAAVVFYLLYAAGLLFFSVSPAQSLMHAALLGAALGLIAYGTYDLTNHATMKEWPLVVTLVDIAWGAFLSASAASLGYLALRIFG